MIRAYGKLRLREPFADGRERTRRNAQVENPVARQSQPPFNVFESGFERPVSLLVFVPARLVEQPVGEDIPTVFLQGLA